MREGDLSTSRASINSLGKFLNNQSFQMNPFKRPDWEPTKEKKPKNHKETQKKRRCKRQKKVTLTSSLFSSDSILSFLLAKLALV